jgi:hypothetical protein
MGDTKIPEDLREEYTELKFCAPRDGINHYMRACAEFIERIARLESELSSQKVLFDEHTKAVGKFLSDMYAVMIDPLDSGDLKVAEMCELLLIVACENRQALQDQLDRAGNLPANWKEDSSLETWFPLTVEELKRKDAELSLLRGENERLRSDLSFVAEMKNNFMCQRDDARGENERLKAPVSDEEWRSSFGAICLDDVPMSRSEVNQLISGRAGQPLPVPPKEKA